MDVMKVTGVPVARFIAGGCPYCEGMASPRATTARCTGKRTKRKSARPSATGSCMGAVPALSAAIPENRMAVGNAPAAVLSEV